MAEKFGERIRRVRTAKGLGLRETATKLEISATYLSRIETNEEKTPPAEKVIRNLATLLNEDFDELMSLAGRVSEDVSDYITKQPGLPAFLRQAQQRKLTVEDLQKALESKRTKK